MCVCFGMNTQLWELMCWYMSNIPCGHKKTIMLFRVLHGNTWHEPLQCAEWNLAHTHTHDKHALRRFAATCPCFSLVTSVIEVKTWTCELQSFHSSCIVKYSLQVERQFCDGKVSLIPQNSRMIMREFILSGLYCITILTQYCWMIREIQVKG